jgi:hypothetical protein
MAGTPANPPAGYSLRLQVECLILKGRIVPKQVTKEFKVKKLIHRCFQDDHTDFNLGPYGISFWVTGTGRNVDDAMKNARVWANKIRQYLESVYDCELGTPEIIGTRETRSGFPNQSRRHQPTGAGYCGAMDEITPCAWDPRGLLCSGL